MYASLIPSDNTSKLFCLVKELKAIIVNVDLLLMKKKCMADLYISRAHFNVAKLVCLTSKKKKMAFTFLFSYLGK